MLMVRDAACRLIDTVTVHTLHDHASICAATRNCWSINVLNMDKLVIDN
jgi:hypothetical protein